MSGIDDDVRGAIADAIRQADYECEMAESVQMPFASWTEHQVDAVLSVPAVRDALARDAKVREIVERWRSTPWRHDPTTIQAIVHLYPEVASMLRDWAGQ